MIGFDLVGLGWIELVVIGMGLMNLSSNRMVLVGLDWIGVGWIWLGVIGLGLIRLDWVS